LDKEKPLMPRSCLYGRTLRGCLLSISNLMSLTVATLLPGLLFIALGALLLISNSTIQFMLKALPRSQAAAVVFFGGGALWFLYRVWFLSPADLVIFSTPQPWFVCFAALAGLAFFYVPDFLAVRGLSVLALLGGWPLLMAAYMEYDKPQRLVMVTGVFVAVSLAIYLGLAPYRLRDFFQWLYATRGRARIVGGALLAYGVLLVGTAFAY
jgi:hypothetical protein